ncbi:MAG: nitrous oxide reductase accessory protein NosL [Myxococcota bacterium]
MLAALVIAALSSCRDNDKAAPAPPSANKVTSAAVSDNETSPIEAAPDPVVVSPSEPDSAEAPRVATPQRKLRPADGARNNPPVALYVADRLDFLDKVVTLRVRAEASDYFNCYYKGKQAAYHSIRLFGDGSLYLDAYVPRDPAGERLWTSIRKHGEVNLTVRVIMRAGTLQGVCVGQVEVLDFERGWNYDAGGLSDAGALAARIRNSKDQDPARNRPSIVAWRDARKRFVDKTVTFKVRARLDRYHQCRYRDAERTHYAVRLNGDGFKGLMGYIRRDDTGRKLARYLAADEGGRIYVHATIPEGRYDQLCPDQIEILAWRKGWEH